MYSETGMAPLMIVASVPLFNIYSVIILTYYDSRYDIAKKRSWKETLKDSILNILKNPIIVAIFLAIPFSILQVNFPFIIQKTISNIAVTASPLALIAIGASFELKDSIQKIKPTLVASFIKLILISAIIIPIAIFLGYRNQELIAILIMTASPATATCFVMSKNMGNDASLSSSIIVMTTLLSSITLTLWIFILKGLGYL